MRPCWRILTGLALSWLSVGAPALADDAASGSKDAAPGSVQSPAAPRPVVSESADRALKEAADFIGSANEFAFTADVMFDHVLPSGQKLQFSGKEEVALQRPGKLHVDWTGDLGARRFWYDGATITLYDPSTPFYASEDAPPGLDAMLDKLINQLGFSPPLTNLFRSDPYGAARSGVQYGVDLGLSRVGDRNCRSLAFVQKANDWQVWIAAGTQPTLCKLTITYKTLPSEPQFSAVFSDWDFSPRFGERAFTPTLPSGLEKIPFDDISSAR
jgi:hypothetical protein